MADMGVEITERKRRMEVGGEVGAGRGYSDSFMSTSWEGGRRRTEQCASDTCWNASIVQE